MVGLMDVLESSIEKGNWRRLTSTRKKRSTGIVVWRRLSAQMCQDDGHVALSDTELAVQHH